ncbi:hypothetical protein ACIBQ1_03515 [Nonomuraea sp. NPDC050153]|uniref:hypothetical protein n=1 Tax=Nonomuraea sp. NPDC050153 TaxID=3364359 RepID=UPI0037B16112
MMAGRMIVVAVRRSGHAVGAITMAAGATPAVADVAGAAVPYRLAPGTPVFDVPAADLAVAEVEFDERVFQDVKRARMLFPGGSEQSASLAFVKAGTVEVEVDPEEDTLVIKAPGSPGEDVPFWALIQPQENGPSSVVTGEIPKGGVQSEPVAHGLTKGDTYSALVLVAGLTAHQEEITVP